jgi:catechol 2,3-dioxygenase-like lactoylglutathione lyase family enzyme
MPDPTAAAAWYAEHLGFRIMRGSAEPPFAHFITPADGGGAVIEMFRSQAVDPLDAGAADPMQAHIAFVVEDVDAAAARLVAAGAVADGGTRTSPDGDPYAILRDPWGVPLQLIRRSVPLEPVPGGDG